MKKNIITLLSLIAISNLFAQTPTSEAFAKSYEFEYKKDYNSAIQVLDNIYLANSYEINLRLGWLNYAKGDFNKSENYYKNAIKLEPKSVEAKLGLAYPISAQEKWTDLILVYNNILKIDPYNYTVNLRMATIYYYKKDFEIAREYGLKMSKRYPFDYNYNLILGKINLSLGNIIHAKKHLNKALLNTPTSEEVIQLLKAL